MQPLCSHYTISTSVGYQWLGTIIYDYSFSPFITKPLHNQYFHQFVFHYATIIQPLLHQFISLLSSMNRFSMPQDDSQKTIFTQVSRHWAW